jgi:hypothetical protein
LLEGALEALMLIGAWDHGARLNRLLGRENARHGSLTIDRRPERWPSG